MKELTDYQIDHLTDHIIYRVSALKAGIISHKGNRKRFDIGTENACFIGCAAMVRVFMEFFGLKVKYDPDINADKLCFGYSGRGTDVKSESIVNGSSLSENEIIKAGMKDVLIRAYRTAERAAVHYTDYSYKGGYGGEDDMVIEAAEYLKGKLDEKLYEPLGLKLTTKWREGIKLSDIRR